VSSAFVKEEEGQWLHDIPPTMAALINYLTSENNGVRVYEQRAYMDEKEGREVHVMSNGLNYAVGDDSKWYIVW
jgi:hypothetical protein